MGGSATARIIGLAASLAACASLEGLTGGSTSDAGTPSDDASDAPPPPPVEAAVDAPGPTGPPSCASGGDGGGNANHCGPNHSDDCCASTLVTGGAFDRSNDPAFPATVGDFRLDVYEVTVGRFANFIDHGTSSQDNP